MPGLLSDAQALHKTVGLPVGLSHPFHDLIRLRRVLELDAHRPVKPDLLEGFQIWREVYDSAARRQVAVLLALAVGEVAMRDAPLQTLNLRCRCMGERQV